MMATPTVIFEDKDYLVVNKPAGLVVTPGPGHEDLQDTLAGWAIEHVGDELVGVGQAGRWGIVHRLDKDVSGVMVVTKTKAAYESLVGQFKERVVEKKYRALVWGRLGEGRVIREPIKRHPKNSVKFAVRAGGKPAETRVRGVGVFGELGGEVFSLVDVFPKTGRTHQIRVHLSHIGHAIVGDPVYSGRKRWRWAKENLELTRPFLHAMRLRFSILDKGTGEFETELSEELRMVLKKFLISN